MRTPYGHLTYCTNIHPGESWPDHFAALQQHFPRIKAVVAPTSPMGIGLRLSDEASRQLAKPTALEHFREWLQQQDAYVFTMNGFPFGGFHHTRVKDQVHAPDWTTNERTDYTIRLFELLSQLLPDGLDGGVSTSPLSYRFWFATPEALLTARKTATHNMLRVVARLSELYRDSGKLLHLDIEPEPDGLLETGPEFIEWFENDLLPAGTRYFSEMGMSRDQAVSVIKTHLRLCYDVCHFAIGYESHGQVLETLRSKGIQVGKIQVSAALKAAMPQDLGARLSIANAFAGFNEPTYLHQVVARTDDGSLLRYRDLPDALPDAGNPAVTEWRAHFHVPIFESAFGLVQSTRSDIEEVLRLQGVLPFTQHLEVETYTWTVLDQAVKLPMAESIARELTWVKEQMPG